MSQRKGILYLAVCSLLWSTAGVLIKIIPWHSMIIGGLRSAIAGLVLWLALLREGYKAPLINRNTVCIGLYLGVSTVFFVAANKLTTAANAIVLQSANPIFVLLFCALWYHQKFSRRDLIVVAVTMAGVGLFFLDQLSLDGIIGNCLALASAILLALVFIRTSDAASLHESMSGIMLGHCVSVLCSLPFWFTNFPAFTLKPTLAILFLGVFQLGIPYALLGYASRLCSPLAVSLIGMLEPIFSPIWVALFIHEIPGPLALTGGVLVIITLTVWCVLNARDTAKQQ